LAGSSTHDQRTRKSEGMIPRFKIFRRLYWTSDAGGYIGMTAHSNDCLIVWLGPIMVWIRK
jgi:hypothetical protein